MMASMKILIAACLITAVAEGHYNFFPNFGFGGFPPQVSYFRPPPLPQLPRLPGFFQPLLQPLPQPPLLPMFNNFRMSFPGPPTFEDTLALRQPDEFSESVDQFTDFGNGGFSGMTFSTTNTGNGGVVTVITNTENGKTQTFISPPPQGDNKFYRLQPTPDSLRTPSFPVPEIRVPKVKKFPNIPLIDMNVKPSMFNNFKAKAVGSTFRMSSKDGEKPKFFSEVISVTNDNGKIDKKVSKYEN